MIRRGLALILVSVYFSTNSALAYVQETNFWQERQKQVSLSHSGESRNPVLNLGPGFRRGDELSQFGTLHGKLGGIIHVQDIHQNLEAQQNIAKALQQLIQNKQVDLIALEGAFDPIDLSAYQKFSDQNAVQKVADYLLRENKISGPIYALMTNSSPVPVIGIDDKTHYDLNVEAVRAALAEAPVLKQTTADQKRALEEKKAAVFNPALKAFDTRVESYRQGTLPFSEFVKYFRPTGGALHTFLSALAIEESIDFKRVELERSRVLQELSAHLSTQDTNILLTLTSAFQAERINHAEFYGTLKKLCEKNGVHLAQYPSMNAYLQYVLLTQSIDSDKLLTEAGQAEKTTFEALTKTPEEKNLVLASRQLYLTQKLLDLALTKGEWTEYKPVGEKLNNFENFYREAKIRDQLMSENLQEAIKKYHAKNTVVVTGGFHTLNVQATKFVPKLTKIDTANGSAYLSVFAQEKTPLDKLFEGQKLFLADNPAQLGLGKELMALATSPSNAAKVLAELPNATIKNLGDDREKLTEPGLEITADPNLKNVRMEIITHKLNQYGPYILSGLIFAYLTGFWYVGGASIFLAMSVDKIGKGRIPNKELLFNDEKDNGVKQAPELIAWVLNKSREARLFNVTFDPAVSINVQILDLANGTQEKIFPFIGSGLSRFDEFQSLINNSYLPDNRRNLIKVYRYEDHILMVINKRESTPMEKEATFAAKKINPEPREQPRPSGPVIAAQPVLEEVSEAHFPDEVRKEADFLMTGPWRRKKSIVLTVVNQETVKFPPDLIAFAIKEKLFAGMTHTSLTLNRISTDREDFSTADSDRRVLIGILDFLKKNSLEKKITFHRGTRAWDDISKKMKTKKSRMTPIVDPEVIMVNPMDFHGFDHFISFRAEEFADWILNQSSKPPLKLLVVNLPFEANHPSATWPGGFIKSEKHPRKIALPLPGRTDRRMELAPKIAGLYKEIVKIQQEEGQPFGFKAHVLKQKGRNFLILNVTNPGEELNRAGAFGFANAGGALLFWLRDFILTLSNEKIRPWLYDSLFGPLIEQYLLAWIFYPHMGLWGAWIFFALLHLTNLAQFGRDPKTMNPWITIAMAVSLTTLNIYFGLSPLDHNSILMHITLNTFIACFYYLSGGKVKIATPIRELTAKLFDWLFFINPQLAWAGKGTTFVFSNKKITVRGRSDKNQPRKPVSNELVQAFDAAVKPISLRDSLKKKLLALPPHVKVDTMRSSIAMNGIPGVALTREELKIIQFMMIFEMRQYRRQKSDAKEQLYKNALVLIEQKQYAQAEETLFQATAQSEDLDQLTFDVWETIGRMACDGLLKADQTERALQILTHASNQLEIWKHAPMKNITTYETDLFVYRAELLFRKHQTFAAIRVLSHDEYGTRMKDLLAAKSNVQSLWEKLSSIADSYIQGLPSDDSDYLKNNVLPLIGKNHRALIVYRKLIYMRIVKNENADEDIQAAKDLAKEIEALGTENQNIQDIKSDFRCIDAAEKIEHAFAAKQYQDVFFWMNALLEEHNSVLSRHYFDTFVLYRAQALFEYYKGRHYPDKIEAAELLAQRVYQRHDLTDPLFADTSLLLAEIYFYWGKPYHVLNVLSGRSESHIHPALRERLPAYLLAIHANADVQRDHNVAVIAAEGLKRFPENHELRQWQASTRINPPSSTGLDAKFLIWMIPMLVVLGASKSFGLWPTLLAAGFFIGGVVIGQSGNRGLPGRDLRLAMPKEGREMVTQIIYPAAGFDRLVIKGIFQVFPNLETIYLIDPRYGTDHDKGLKKDLMKYAAEAQLAKPLQIHLLAENYLKIPAIPAGTGRTLLINKGPGDHSALIKNPDYWKSIERDLRPQDYILSLLAHKTPASFGINHQLLADIVSLTVYEIELNSFRLWQVSPPTAIRIDESDSLAVHQAIEDYRFSQRGPVYTVKTMDGFDEAHHDRVPDLVAKEIWEAYRDKDGNPYFISRSYILRTSNLDAERLSLITTMNADAGQLTVEDLFYALSDPYFYVRQTAAAKLGLSKSEKIYERLQQLANNPQVPETDSRMGNKPYDPDVAKQHVREETRHALTLFNTQKNSSALLFFTNPFYKYVGWLPESALVSFAVSHLPLNPMLGGVLAAFVWVGLHFIIDKIFKQKVERNWAEMIVTAFILHAVGCLPLAWNTANTYSYFLAHAWAHFIWTFKTMPAPASRPLDLELRQAMMKPTAPMKKREIKIIEISQYAQANIFLKNISTWQNTPVDHERDVIFIIAPALIGQVRRYVDEHAFIEGHTVFLQETDTLTVEGVLRDAHRHLESRTSATVALFATSNRWADMDIHDFDLSDLPISVVGLVRYMVDIAQDSLTPIETRLKTAAATEKAA